MPRPPLFLKSLCVLVPLLGIASAGHSAAERPNIVVFLVDDMGVMDTSVPFLTDEAGRPRRYPLNEYYRTPNMERLAARGIRFNQFYAMSVCSPTRICDHDRPECGAASHHQLDQSRPGQRRPARPAGVELEGIEEGGASRWLACCRPTGIARSTSARGTSARGSPKGRSRGTWVSTSTWRGPRSGRRRVTTARPTTATPAARSRRPPQRRAAPGEIPRHRHVPHRGPHDRGERPRLRGREGGTAVLPLLRPVRRPRPVQLRPAVRRALSRTPASRRRRRRSPR